MEEEIEGRSRRQQRRERQQNPRPPPDRGTGTGQVFCWKHRTQQGGVLGGENEAPFAFRGGAAEHDQLSRSGGGSERSFLSSSVISPAPGWGPIKAMRSRWKARRSLLPP